MPHSGKKFSEKVFFKVVVNTDTKQIVNGNGHVLVTVPESQSIIVTTNETGHKYLTEKPDTTVTNIVYNLPENASVTGSPIILNHQTNIKEKDSFVSFIGTDILPGGTQIIPTTPVYSVVTGASGRFEGATTAKSIGVITIDGNILTMTQEIIITGYRNKHHHHSGKHHHHHSKIP